jgi:hypothetical protein
MTWLGWLVSNGERAIESTKRLIEKALIDFLDMQGILNSAPDVVPDHELG